MLNKTTFTHGIAMLSRSINKNKNLDIDNQRTLTIWYACLRDIDNDLFQKSCLYILQNSQWFPSIYDIRATAAMIESISSDMITTPEIEWQLFQSAATSIPGSSQLQMIYDDGGSYFSNSITDTVAKNMLMDFAMSSPTETGNWRSRFINTYKSLSKRQQLINATTEIEAALEQIRINQRGESEDE